VNIQPHEITAVILAAGSGSRLQGLTAKSPKPLIPLLGLTLLQRSILSCREVGIRNFAVVVGHRKTEIIPHLRQIQERYHISVQVVENPNWERGNGTSVSACAPYLSGPFLLLMSDHVFEPKILYGLMASGEESTTCSLLVDRRTDQIFDEEEATRVSLNGNMVTAIGKGLKRYDAVDTGFFLCQQELFDALETAMRKGDGTLSGGIQQLIQDNKVIALDIGNHFWFDIDTPEGLVHAKQCLLDRLSKPGEDGIISRLLNRALSRRITEWLVATNVSPNQITLVSFLMGLLAAFLFTVPGYLYSVLGGLTTQFASIVDGCDGEIARLKFQSSRFGAWFDTVLDRYCDVAIATAIIYREWTTHPSTNVWLLGILAISGFVLASYTKKEFSLRYEEKIPGGIVEKVTKRDLRFFAIFVGGMVNKPFEVMVLMGLISHAAIGWVLSSIGRREKWRG